MNKFKKTSFKIHIRTILLFVINFSIYDLNIKVNKNEEISKATFKEKKHTINQVKEKSTTFNITRKLCSYIVIVNRTSFLKMQKRLI